MSKIFILYRPGENDEASYAIYKALSERFGNRCFLLGCDPAQYQSIGLHVQHIFKAWSVFLVVIVPRGFTSSDQYGNLQLLKSNDPLRQILSRALAMPQALVLPVLVEGAAMPASRDLPPDLAQLHYRNAATIRRGVEVYQDVDRIVRSIRAFWPIRKRFSYPRFAYAQSFLLLGAIVLDPLFSAIIPAVPFSSAASDFLIYINLLFNISLVLLLIGIWIATLILTIRIQRWGWFFLTLLLSWLGMSLFFAFFGPVSKPKRKTRKA